MPTVSASKRIEAEPSHLFDALADPNNLPLLYRRLSLTPEEPEVALEKGAMFKARYVPLVASLFEYNPSVTVSESSRPERLTLSADEWLRWEWTIAGYGPGSLVQLEHHFKMVWSGQIGEVLGKALAFRVQADVRSSVDTLQRLVDKSS